MKNESMTGWIKGFFSVAVQKQTYLNLVYILFTFPLGTAYFIFLVTGLSMGLSLSITLIGLPILLITFLAWWELAAFERQLAIHLLNIDVPPMKPPARQYTSALERFKDQVLNPVTWKGLAFLFIKFPFGIFSLITVVTMTTLAIGLILSPITYQWHTMYIGMYVVETSSVALILSCLGLMLGVISLHITNMLAVLSGKLAYWLLGGNFSKEQDEGQEKTDQKKEELEKEELEKEELEKEELEKEELEKEELEKDKLDKGLGAW